MGTLVAVAGWEWAALLIGYFIVSSALTRVGRERKAGLTASVLPDASARDAAQVLANGGLFATLVLLGEVLGSPALYIAGMGALSAAAADTWATEVGMLWGGTPRTILTLAKVEPGVSGGVTLIGTAAGVAAAATMALLAPTLVGSEGAPAVLAAGIAGTIGDSVLGATLQSQRWCDQCRTWTERRVHTCGYRTQHARGLRWMTNDTVNLLATAFGALVALAVIGTRR